MPKALTILMLTRNRLESLKRAVESLNENTDRDSYKLVVMDSGGSDHSDSWLIPYCKQEGIDLQYIYSPENIGWIPFFNKMYASVETEFSLSVHDDCVFPKYWLDHMMRRFKDPEVAAVGPKITYAMGPQATAYGFQSLGVIPKYLLGLFFMCRQSVLEEVRRHFYNGEHYFSPDYGMGDKEELELCYRIRQLGYKFKIAHDVVVEHEGNGAYIATLGSMEEFTKYQDSKLKILIDRLGQDVVNDIYQVDWNVPKVMFGIMTRTEYMHHHFVFSLLKIWGATVVQKALVHVARGHVAESRTHIVDKFLETDCDYLLFLDDDMRFNEHSLNTLLAHDVDMASYLAHQRGKPHAPCIFYVRPDTKTFHPVMKRKEGLIEVDAVGGFYLLIKRKVIENMKEPYFIYGDKSLGFGGEKGIGEDLYFSAKAKLSGAELWINTDYTVGHIGPEEVIDEEYIQRLEESGEWQKMIEEAEEKSKAKPEFEQV